MKTFVRVMIAVLLAFALNSSATEKNDNPSLPFSKFQVYYVMIENVPDEMYPKIIYKSFEIGEIVDKELTASGTYVQIKVRIHEQYLPLIHTNATFYFDEAILRYYALKETGEPLAEESRIMGFDNQIDLNLAIAKMKAEEWYEDFREWSKEKIAKFK